MSERRRLFLDIETSPLQVFVWSLNDKANAYISHKSIVKDRGIICICYKWEGIDKIYSLTWDKKQSDKKMLQEFVSGPLANATEIVAHNGDRFDLPWIRGRRWSERENNKPRSHGGLGRRCTHYGVRGLRITSARTALSQGNIHGSHPLACVSILMISPDP